MTEPVTVLIVEDDQLIQGMVEEALSDGGFKSVITGSGSGEEARANLYYLPCDCFYERVWGVAVRHAR